MTAISARSFRWNAVALTVFWGACLSAAAQQDFLVRQLQSPTLAPGTFGDFGTSLLVADINQDGFDDLVSMESRAAVDGVEEAGKGWILFGPQLTSFLPLRARDPLKGERFGEKRGSVADFNGDGHLDLLVGAIYANSLEGRVHLLLGPDFETLRVFGPPAGVKQEGQAFGWASVMLPDPEGARSAYVGSPRYDATWDGVPQVGAGSVFVHDLAGGQLLRQIDPPLGPYPTGAFGESIFLHDLTGDGVQDILIGELGAKVEGVLGAQGIIHVLDGASLEWAPIIKPPDLWPWVTGFGKVHHVGDLSGDGVDDLFVGAISTRVDMLTLAGEALILLGPDFRDVLAVLPSPMPSGNAIFGDIAVAADFNQDGATDVAISDPFVSLGNERVRLWYGPEFVVRRDLGGIEDLGFLKQAFGQALAQGDFDGDGFPELAIHTNAGNGQVYIFDPVSLTAEPTTLSLSSGGSVSLSLDLGYQQAGHSYLALLSASGGSPGRIVGPGSYLPLEVDGVTALGFALKNSALLPGFGGQLDASGHASLAIHLPAGIAPWLAGKTLTVAAIVIDEHGAFGAGSTPVSIQLAP